MALPPSTLSQVARSVADFVSEGLDAANLSVRVMLGTPADAAPKEGDTEHRVNLFFYRVEPFGFAPDGAPDETGWIRLHCLITAFGVLEDQISVGENDLRLLGEVLRLFHETPVLDTLDVDGTTIQLQVVQQDLSPDDINHLWSTQGDVAYRTSVAYEMAVAPILPKEPGPGVPLVGSVGYEVRHEVKGNGKAFAGVMHTPPAVAVTVNTAVEGWAPHICFVYSGTCAYSLAFELQSDALGEFEPAVAVVGEPGSSVTLRWDQWKSDAGWVTAATGVDTQAATLSLDPEQAAALATTSVDLPFRDAAGQAVLYAVREYTRASDGATLSARSNPLLVTLYEAAP